MINVVVLLADGFEEMEAFTPVDVWRRARFNVITVSINKTLNVTGAHAITVVADKLFDDVSFNEATMIFLPGGIPGATNLDAHEGLKTQIIRFNTNGKLLGAICAAPLILGHNNILKGKKATCFPGFEKELLGAIHTNKSVQIDKNIVTGKGAGVALEFALTIVAKLKNEEFAMEIAKNMQVSNEFKL